MSLKKCAGSAPTAWSNLSKKCPDRRPGKIVKNLNKGQNKGQTASKNPRTIAALGLAVAEKEGFELSGACETGCKLVRIVLAPQAFPGFHAKGRAALCGGLGVFLGVRLGVKHACGADKSN